MKYICLIHKENKQYVATIPDLNNVSTFGDTFEEVIHNIKEASELYCEDLKTLPKASNLDIILKNYSK